MRAPKVTHKGHTILHVYGCGLVKRIYIEQHGYLRYDAYQNILDMHSLQSTLRCSDKDTISAKYY